MNMFESLECRQFLSASTPAHATHAVITAGLDDALPRVDQSASASSLQPVNVQAQPRSAGSLTVTPLTADTATTTVLRLSSATSVSGQPITLRAGVSATFGAEDSRGTVTFRAGTTVLGTASVRADSTARLTLNTLPVGRSVITASYSGNNDFLPSTSAGRAHVVALAPTFTRLSVFPASVTLGQDVAVVARVSNLEPSTTTPFGRVQLYRDGELVASKRLNSAGAARFVYNNLFTGDHSFRAIYLGSTQSEARRSALRTVTIAEPTYTTQPNGLQIATAKPGTGPGVTVGGGVLVNYTGYLTNGTLFDTSLQPGRTPFPVQPVGSANVIQGWNEGLVGIKVGETRVLRIPASLAYGNASPSPDIPPNSTLIFIVEALQVV
jgi:hypothetical protein